ncbi:MAG: hypothetical protein WA691_08535 [Thermoplasmata archaeon]
MRTGLLLAGLAVAVIGVGVILASLSFPTGPSGTQLDTLSAPTIQAHATLLEEVVGVNESSAQVNLVWAASQEMDVALYSPGPCPHSGGTCPTGAPIISWVGDTGKWSASGSLSFPLYLNLTNPNGTIATFSGTLVETYSTSVLTDPTWSLFVPLLGAVVLIAIGGVAIFLGMFLGRGVYSGSTAPPTRYDGWDEEYEGDDPDFDSIPEDDEPTKPDDD